MVQLVLRKGRAARRPRWTAILLLISSVAWASHPKPQKVPAPPDLLLEGGRKLTYETAFSAEQDVRKPGFWGKVFDIVAGEPQMHRMIRPYGIVVDSQGRAIVTDPGAGGIHIFDFAHHKYKFIDRSDKGSDSMQQPQCITIDSEDNFYVTDSQSGKIFVFSPDGKFKRAVGSLRGGEGYFKRPTGIAVDLVAKRIYVSDTLRDKLFTLDLDGNVLNSIGEKGSGDLQFNFPTELRIDHESLLVIDAMNFRVQHISLDGRFLGAFGHLGETTGDMYRPKGIAIDSEGHYYIVDGLLNNVQIFNQEGQLLYYFGGPGTNLGHFQLPSGIFIDKNDRIWVVDSYNQRVQVFHYYGHASLGHGENR